ncbi:MAG: D-2-hydroxyacid dehydrogenase [Clostridia bacterium]|nr:D-2-hydroxyacid dehydrogenase [Clostridia bacterium]
MKIVVLDGKMLNPGDLSWEALKKLGEVTIYDRTGNDQIVSRIGDAEIVLTNKTPIRRETLDQVNNLRYISVLATGFDVVDIKYASKKRITVSNAPAYSTNSVAQMVFALLLEICHQVGDHNQKTKEGKWSRSIDFSFWDHPLYELKDKTMGIIGFGQIGRQTADIALAFGMNVLVATRTVDKALEKSGLSFVSLEKLYSNSDVISLHCPATDSTKEMINMDTISKMKKGVILINTARGALVAEEDLAEALKTGHIAYAAVDVLSKEPADINNPLLQAPNCFITPHIAWATKEARQRLMDITVKNVVEFQGGHPVNVVNS